MNKMEISSETTFFSEINEVLNIVTEICFSELNFEKLYERFKYIIERYQEQSQILAPHTSSLLDAPNRFLISFLTKVDQVIF